MSKELSSKNVVIFVGNIKTFFYGANINNEIFYSNLWLSNECA